MKRANDAVFWFMSELTSRIVSESGIPSDRFHLGKIILQSFKDAPDAILQIDGATGESMNYAEALQKSVQCAISMRNLGLKLGDVMVLMAPNHLDIVIPFYAALYLGVAISAVDRTLNVKELRGSFNITKPKIVFCQSEKATEVQLVLNELELNAHIITFDKGHYLFSFHEFLEKYGDDTPVEEYRPQDLDAETAYAFLVATSGTTGLPKCAACTHKNFAISGPYLWVRMTQFPTPTRLILIGSPLQWLTAIFHFLVSPIMRYPRLQTSAQLTQKHAYYLINTYKPSYTILSPTFMTTLIRPEDRDQCDFSCFELILLGGSAVSGELIQELKEIIPHVEVINTYGMSELCGIAFDYEPTAPASCGKLLRYFQSRLVNVDTQEDILEPNLPGELWLKGPSIFPGYYNNEEATAETFADDGWFKTGDLFYCDAYSNFYFVERIKLMLKYKSYQISPVEVENVIRQHPGVIDVAVTGISDDECGDLLVACVVPIAGAEVTAQDVKDIVRENLSDSKQLRGGVIFVDAIPVTATTKVHRRRLKEMALTMERL